MVVPTVEEAVTCTVLCCQHRPDIAEAARRELRGKNLGVLLPLPAPGEPDRCHAAVLLEWLMGRRGADLNK